MSETFALLLTDVVDSTQLNDQLGDAAMADLWVAHDRAARELIRQWRGTEVGRSDGFLLMFATVADAVGFALGYHRALAALAVPLKARVGVHVGPIDLRENNPVDTAQGATRFDIYGVAVPVAARLTAAASGGQTLLTAAAVQALGLSGLRTSSHGHWRFKGVSQPIELFQIGESAASFTPPGDSAKAYRVVLTDGAWTPARELPHNLPAERDAFVGRTLTLQALADQFDQGVRLVTLLGMGGIGKTRLSQRYARIWMGDYPGGAWFCDLSSARGVDGIVHAVAQGLAVPLGKTDPVQQLGAAIAGRGLCLVILDNFEQVAGQAEATLGAWLGRAPQARFIATSREVLGVVGERSLVLAPLGRDEAVTMFRQRVRAVGAMDDFSVSDEAALLPLVDLLDCLPLAIELAAARVRVMTPGTLLRRMGERFKLLATRGGRHDRQATLRATLDWSWELLSACERSALAQLSVFVGGFTLEAAEAVLLLSEAERAPEALNIVQSLVEKSLVRSGAAERFEMLVAVQDYAAERLQEAGTAAANECESLAQTQLRHGQFFAALESCSSLATVWADLDNLVAATRRAVRAGRVEIAVGALEGAWAALKFRGPFRIGVELADEVRSMAALDSAAQAHIDRIAGSALKSCGRVAEAEARFQAALPAARAAGIRPCEGQVLCYLGDLDVRAGRAEAARIHLEAALCLARELNHLVLECEASTGLGNLDELLGQVVGARAHYESALASSRRAGDRHWEGGSLGNLGVLCANQGKMAEAAAYYGQALAVARELGDRRWEGNTLCNLGLMHQVQGKLELAASELDAALLTARELGHVRLECVVLCNLGIVVEAMQVPDVARGHYEAALSVARALGDRRSEGQVLSYLGVLHARQGRFDQARACLGLGQQHLTEVQDQLNLALLHCGRAECEYLAGALDTADHSLAEAQTLAHEIGAESGSELQGSIDRVQRLTGLPTQRQAPMS